MPWCPNCREEYREGFGFCKDCDCALVAELPPLPPPLPVEETPQPPANDGWHIVRPKAYTLPGPMEHPALLTATADPVRLEMLLDLLEQAGVHAFAADDSTGRYTRLYMGVSVYNREIYVEQAQLAEAQAILEGYFSEEEPEALSSQDGYDDEEPQEDYGYSATQDANPLETRREWVRAVLFVVVGMSILSMLVGAFRLLQEYLP